MADEQQELWRQVEEFQAVADPLDPAQGSQVDLRRKFEKLRQTLSRQRDSFTRRLARLMNCFLAGLFLAPVDEMPRGYLVLER